ncbi:MAG: hypothetical protein D6687_00705 [Acidobacteria bacterium]|jgi:hypothetical protein|nr:MAG: hypothetical protein D6687_00705 [Acidobacteriota bacterium]GIU83192.1 MAG: hypothetical protein KatS3mg006_2256 [Pyrinomonadaceae bacterium]
MIPEETFSANVKKSLLILLSNAIDYAGLFPPAKLSMKDAVKNYAEYKSGRYSWMLGRFIVPASRLDEFVENAERYFRSSSFSWQLSVIVDGVLEEIIESVENFNKTYMPYAQCDTFELKTNSIWFIEEASEIIPASFTNYFEILPDEDLAELVSTIALRKQRAKIRTGGITEDAFPRTEDLARFIRTCLAANVPFKATAGLHHPLRCKKPLTYEPNSPVGVMFGFLNVFVGAAFARNSISLQLLHQILEEENPQNFSFTEEGIYWRENHFVGNWHLEQLRQKGIISFGSCSFEEPVAELIEIGLL